jgi:hypothetical protein
LERAPAAGRTLFDHSWVEAYFIHAIERASESIDHLQQKASGPRGGDLRTERHAEEVMRWA